MISKLRLTDMLGLQNKLNVLINPAWLDANYTWTRAILVEAAEGLEHVGWKWWKKQTPNVDQAKIELVDIWHFMLSHELQANQGDIDKAAEEILRIANLPKDQIYQMMGRTFRISDLTTQAKFDALAGTAAFGYTFLPGFVGLMEDLGMSWNELYSTYVAKNVLNIFRQEHGYKDGTYIKDWNGKEDNEVLQEIMEHHTGITADGVMQALEANYRSLTGAEL